MLAVVTNTRFDRNWQLERCCESVNAALPFGSRHFIIGLDDDFGQGRYDAFMTDEIVALVDDDDTVHPDSISYCLDALLSTDSDVAFTNENVVSESGKYISPGDQSIKSFKGLAASPRHAHHLVMIRRSAISPIALEMHQKYGAGIEWFVTLSAAFNRSKVIHVPINGYNWTVHEDKPSRLSVDVDTFRFRIEEMKKDINTNWNIPNIKIPIYNIAQRTH